MAKTILELQGVVKRYGATLGVGPVDVDVREGEFLTLLGSALARARSEIPMP